MIILRQFAHTILEGERVSIKMYLSLRNRKYDIHLSYTEELHFLDFDHMGMRLEWLINNHPFCLFRLCESPMEIEFFAHSFHVIRNLKPQWAIGPYRADFAIPSSRIAIEIDGHDGHKTKAQRTKDARRERHIKTLGWEVIRFTGSEIYKDVLACVDETRAILGNSLVSPKNARNGKGVQLSFDLQGG